jgi:hypothetical protein
MHESGTSEEDSRHNGDRLSLMVIVLMVVIVSGNQSCHRNVLEKKKNGADLHFAKAGSHTAQNRIHCCRYHVE